jgi:carboxypeptidase C (cathepsin A)
MLGCSGLMGFLEGLGPSRIEKEAKKGQGKPHLSPHDVLDFVNIIAMTVP